ncbi:hypothetical protein [Alkalibacillus almallahensis]|uniref:hypothetical protein n=1 Tax=Alkalibacillus almallahensis TaxID=1379154 RepID=UPI001420BF36|nr:hypothetical protein [Alkalibacillus almallahensis]
MTKTYEFFSLFLKGNVYNKMNLFWVVFIPLILFLINYSNWFVNRPQEQEAYLVLAFFWSLMILISAVINTAVSLFMMREEGFLKMFSFIAGSKRSIIFGKGLANLLFLIVSMIVFNLVVALLFQMNPFMLIMNSLLLIAVTFIPVVLFFSWIMTLPFKEDSIAPAFSLLTIVLMYLTSDMVGVQSPLFLINPAEFILRVAEAVIISDVVDVTNMLTLASVGCIYMIIGLVTIKLANLESRTIRQ